MSASLLRRGLELLELPGDAAGGVSGKVKKMKTKSSSSPMVRQGPSRSRTTVKHKRIKSAVVEFRRKQKKNQTSANLQYFLDAAEKTTASYTMKILHQNTGRQSRNHPEHKVQKTKETQSLFTEEEFQQFQKEYFGRTVEK